MCKCKADREAAQLAIREAMLQAIQTNTYTSLIMEKDALNDPIFVRYNGTGGMRPFTGRNTRNRYFFGQDHKTGWVERSDAEEFLTRVSGGSKLFVLEQEPFVPTNDVTTNKLTDEQVVEEIVSQMATIEEEPTIEDVEEVIEEIVEESPVTKKRTGRKTKKAE